MAFGARHLWVLVALVVALGVGDAQAGDEKDFSGTIAIGGGRKMYLECRGTGSPTVILISGLRASAEDWKVAAKPGPAVLPDVAKFTRVCAYDRPGTPVGQGFSRSDPVAQPATAGDAAADLHALLSAAGEAPPCSLPMRSTSPTP